MSSEIKKIKSIKIIDPGTAPDVDSDLHTFGRGKVIDYLVDKYGKDNVATIYTPGPFKAKNSFKSMATIYDLPFGLSNQISEKLPDSTMKGSQIKDYLDETNKEGADFRGLLVNDKLKEVAISASEVQGRMREKGTHPCGIILSSEPLTNTIPTEIRLEDGLVVTQWNYYNNEELGLIKMDLLGLATIDLIKDSIDFIKENKGIEINPDDIYNGPLDDKNTFALFQRGDTSGIFQFSGSGVKDMLLAVKPDNFDDLPAITALYRPGPMGMNAHNEFAKKKKDPSKRIPVNDRNFLGTKVEEILSPTNAQLVYQEQIMAIAKDCAGFSSREADDLRKAIGKKKMDLMKSLGEKFKSGMIKNGYPQVSVERLWDGIVGFGEYCFNKSHSVSYALLAYMTAYLKANYPVEFMAAYAKQAQGDPKKFSSALSDIRKMGIKIRATSINDSLNLISPSKEENTIVYGLGAIKGFPQGISDEIIKERLENGKYKNLADFVKRMTPRGLTKGNIVTLAKVGAFDIFDVSRKSVVENADKIYSISKKKVEKAKRPSIFGELNKNENVIDLSKEDYSYSESAKIEADLTGFFLSHHPLDRIKQIREYNLEELNLTDEITFYGTFSSIENKTTKSKFKMCLGTIDNQISQNEFKMSNDLYKAIQKYNILNNIIKDFDGIDSVEQLDYHKDRVEIIKKAVRLSSLENDEIRPFINMKPVKLPDTNIVYKITLGYTNQRNYSSQNTFGRIEILNIEEVPLSKDGRLVYIIKGTDKRKEDLYIKKLYENPGKDTIRIVYLDKSYTDVPNVTFMKGTTQSDILNI